MSERLVFAVKKHCQENGFEQTADLLHTSNQSESSSELLDIFSKYFELKSAEDKTLSFSYTTNNNQSKLRERLMDMNEKAVKKIKSKKVLPKQILINCKTIYLDQKRWSE
jgi:hypothetical protein